MVDRKELIRRMRERGLTYRDIGEILDISRQRAHQILSGYRAKESKKSHDASMRRYRETHREQLREKYRERYARLKQGVE